MKTKSQKMSTLTNTINNPTPFPESADYPIYRTSDSEPEGLTKQPSIDKKPWATQENEAKKIETISDIFL